MGAVNDVFDYLQAHGYAGGSTDWSLLRNRDMDEPALPQLVIVSEDGGGLPEFPASSGVGDSAMARPGVLVMVRGGPEDADAGRDKAQEILDALHGLRNVVLGSASGAPQYYRVAAMTSEPVFLGYDERDRPRHTVAFRLLRDIG